ncbi:molybdopterin converting factor subunit 1 [Sulfurihydrogenibium sp.]|uniref:molybdopterin converting factor subunit 1 n=1 Tax=Sulfurihydrogenibium sp. TaxID=2053621 RepID=UPI002611604E|nr:molybdopterin converting factor subunit 1 [Sulfurihydrogenibium sp.]
MKIEILYFSQIKDKLGRSFETVELDGKTVGDLIDFLVKKYPHIKDILEKSMIAVNEEYTSQERILNENDKVAIIPPVSGG